MNRFGPWLIAGVVALCAACTSRSAPKPAHAPEPPAPQLAPGGNAALNGTATPISSPEEARKLDAQLAEFKTGFEAAIAKDHRPVSRDEKEAAVVDALNHSDPKGAPDEQFEAVHERLIAPRTGASDCERDCINDSGGPAWCSDWCKQHKSYGPPRK